MNSRGYTLMEALVVTLIIAIVAAIIIPNAAASGRGAAVHEYESKLQAEFTNAANNAIREKRPMKVTATNDTFEITPIDDSITISQSTNSASTAQQSTDAYASLALPKGVTITVLKLAGQDTTTADFALTYYRDGKAQDASIEVSEYGKARCLDIYADGRTAWRDGTAADRPAENWPAGSLEQRSE